MTSKPHPGVNEILIFLRRSADPMSVYTAQYIEQLRALLDEALDCVDADEQARFESWPQEVESGDLVLDLGDRIRKVLT